MAEQGLSHFEAQVLESFRCAKEMEGHTVINKKPIMKTIRALKEREGKVYWTVWVITPAEDTVLAAILPGQEKVRFFDQQKMKGYEVKNFKSSAR